ncbi:MAG: UDP-N-acetylglucosamine 1-carboxyvinyltransferase [Puniceicoccales bacterium]|jgi:UDP-N-acetylglucosamine 1-carboxyvinyltransferase|nr:UDP-N-acetylglucosamine 1-carboxyvinyltransferase [Puniceicoccales bacterium]
METTYIVGNRRLVGDVKVSGSKNACLPILAASLLTDEECTIKNVPRLSDIGTMLEIFKALGVDFSYASPHALKIQARNVSGEVPGSLVRKMRASICLMGALLGRLHRVVIPKPGGCVIGDRPFDLHIKGFKALGYKISEEDDIWTLDGKDLHGTTVCLSGPRGSTMTGTTNVVMAAIMIPGQTIIEDAAIEPEVVDFCRYLTHMGAKIKGIGTSVLTIHGGVPLHGCEYAIIGDRMEAGTFVCAGLITGGNIRISGLEFGLLDSFLHPLKKTGANVFQNVDGTIHVQSGDPLGSIDVETGPHPGFPTDLQAQLCTLLTQSGGNSTIRENIYPNRFMYVTELKKMGATIDHVGPCARIKGSCSLKGAHLQATDLRAGAALYLAGLCAKGDTFVHDIFHLDRGYEALEDKLCLLGAKIKRMKVA